MVRSTIKLNRRNTTRSMLSRVRGDEPRKGIFSPRNRTASRKRLIQTITKSNETRRADKRAKRWRNMVDVINDPEILENIGLYIDEYGNLVSSESETINDIQYELLIGELKHRLEFVDTKYEAKIIRKAIKFVTKSREANRRNANTNSLTKMMAAL